MASRNRRLYLPAAIFLGPRLQLAPDVLLDVESKHYALPLPAHPAAA